MSPTAAEGWSDGDQRRGYNDGDHQRSSRTCAAAFIRTLKPGRRALAARPALGIDRFADHGSGLRIAREAPRRRHDDAAQAQQGLEQRLVPDLPERALRRAVRRSLPRAPAQHAFLPALRRRNDVRRQAGGRRGRLQVLEAAGLGQAHHRHGLPLSGALRVHPLLREGQAAPERSGYRGRAVGAACAWRLPG